MLRFPIKWRYWKDIWIKKILCDVFDLLVCMRVRICETAHTKTMASRKRSGCSQRRHQSPVTMLFRTLKLVLLSAWSLCKTYSLFGDRQLNCPMKYLKLLDETSGALKSCPHHCFVSIYWCCNNSICRARVLFYIYWPLFNTKTRFKIHVVMNPLFANL